MAKKKSSAAGRAAFAKKFGKKPAKPTGPPSMGERGMMPPGKTGPEC